MQTVNEIQLSYQKSPIFCYTITESKQAASCMREVFDHDSAQIEVKEYMYALFINSAGEILHYYRLSEGGIVGTIADIRLIFATALKCLATSIVIGHNHPSGQLYPSDPDLTLTQKIADAGKILDIPLQDHIILGEVGYYSFAEHGLL